MLNYQYDPKSWNQQILVAPGAASTAAIVDADAYTAGALPINGSAVALSAATMPVFGNLKIFSAGDDSDVTFTVYGTDNNDNIIVDEFAGANAGTATSNLEFKAILSITPDANTSSLTAGTVAINNAICLTQTGTANTALLLNGTYMSGDFYNANPVFLIITSAANESTNSVTLTATDSSGRAYTSTVTLANAGVVVVQIPARMIRQGDIILANDAAGNISVGVSGSSGPLGQPVTATPWCPIDTKRSVDADGLFVFLSSGATLNYTVQYTNDPIQGAAKGFSTPPSRFVNDTTLVNQTATNSTGLNNPGVACRLLLNSFTSGNALFQFMQQGDFTAAPPAI